MLRQLGRSTLRLKGQGGFEKVRNVVRVQEYATVISKQEVTGRESGSLRSYPSITFSGRRFSISAALNQEESKEKEAEEETKDEGEGDEGDEPAVKGGGEKVMSRKEAPVARHLEKDRRNQIPLETSIRYMKSAAYKETYGDTLVWVLYRRNFPGQWAPKETRKTCIRGGQLATGNPCPICRDEYLVLDYRNVDLLKQFISPYNGTVYHWDKTGVCRNKQRQLLIEIEKAKDYGLITFDVPFREYDYKEYESIYTNLKNKEV